MEVWRRTFQSVENRRARVLQWRLLSKFSEWQEGEQVREAIRSCGEGVEK